MNHLSPYPDFAARLKLLISKNPHLVITTLNNIFTMRMVIFYSYNTDIGDGLEDGDVHGDPAEIAIAEFINQFMYDFKFTATREGQEMAFEQLEADIEGQKSRSNPK